MSYGVRQSSASKILKMIHNSFIKDIYRRTIVNPAYKVIFENIYYNFLFWLKADWEQVSMIFIETTTACNLRCRYCPNSIYDRGLIANKKMMQTELFHKIIDELAELEWAGEIQPHSYGEPLLDDRIIDLIKYARRKIPHLRVDLFTNGQLLTVDLYLELINAGVDTFRVTQHLPISSKGVSEVLKYRRKFGSDNVSFQYYEYNKLPRISNRGGLIEIRNEVPTISCRWPLYNIGIDYSGDVLICCHDYLNQVKVGNVCYESLFDIWNKPLYRNIRKDIYSGRFRLDICKKCSTGYAVTS